MPVHTEVLNISYIIQKINVLYVITSQCYVELYGYSCGIKFVQIMKFQILKSLLILFTLLCYCMLDYEECASICSSISHFCIVHTVIYKDLICLATFMVVSKQLKISVLFYGVCFAE